MYACTVPSGDGAARQLALRLLDPHLLEVDELGLVHVQHEARPVRARRVPADRRLQRQIHSADQPGRQTNLRNSWTFTARRVSKEYFQGALHVTCSAKHS